MKRIIRSLCCVAAIALALSSGTRVSAAEPPREEVAHAYRLLKHADADYKGHRVNAMKELEAAGKKMGLELGGDLPSGERQWQSDAQLREARRLLQDAHQTLAKEDRDRAADRVEKAIKEIDTALAIK